MWMTGTYDPRAEPGLRRHRQSDAGAERRGAPGRQPLDRSIVALNPDTGKLAWGFQASPHDTHDWDAAEVPVLVDGAFNGSAAQAADAGVAQRLLLRPRSHQRQEPADDAVRDGELGDGHRRGRPPDSESRQGAGARRPARRAGRGRRHELPIAELRSGDRPAGRQRARRLRHLLLQAGARRLRLGGRRLRRATSKGMLRAIDYQTGKSLEPRSRRRRRRRRADDRDRADVHRRRRRNVLALRTSDGATLWHSASAASATRRSPTSSTGASTSSSAAGRRSSRSRCRKRRRPAADSRRRCILPQV